MSRDDILVKIRKLEQSLVEDEKNDTASFFSQLLERLDNRKLSESEVNTVLVEVVSCGAISQYAGFNTEQNDYLEDIISLAEREIYPS